MTERAPDLLFRERPPARPRHGARQARRAAGPRRTDRRSRPDLGRPEGADAVDGDGAVLCPGLVDMRAEPRRARLRVPRNHRLRGRGGRRRRHHHPRRPARQPARDRRSCPGPPAARPRRGNRQPHHPALWRRHPRLPRRGAGRARPAARSRRGRLHRRRPRDRPGAADARSPSPTRTASAAIVVQHPEEPTLAAGGAATEGELATRLGLPAHPGRRRGDPGRARHPRSPASPAAPCISPMSPPRRRWR